MYSEKFAVKVFNIKEINGSFFRFSILFQCLDGMPIAKSHGWRIAADDSLLPPSTSWGGRNNVMAEIPTWEGQSMVITQVRSMIALGDFGKLGIAKQKAKKTLVNRGPNRPQEIDYRKDGAYVIDGSILSFDGLCCRCSILRTGWVPAPDCPAHEFPETLESNSVTETSK